MYKVLTYSEDLQDNGHPYHPGDEFPRSGLRVSVDRLMELSGENNRRGSKLIEFVTGKKEEPKAEEPKKAEPKKAATKKTESKKRTKKSE